MSEVWYPGKPNPITPHQVGERAPDPRSRAVVLCGGPYGNTKETGKAVRVHILADMKEIHISSPEDRMKPTPHKGYVTIWRFGPCNQEGVWRPTRPPTTRPGGIQRQIQIRSAPTIG